MIHKRTELLKYAVNLFLETIAELSKHRFRFHPFCLTRANKGLVQPLPIFVYKF